MDIKVIFCYLNLKFPLYSLIPDSACCLLYVKILQNTTSLEYQGKNLDKIEITKATIFLASKLRDLMSCDDAKNYVEGLIHCKIRL